jgi:hypothetical protein
MNFFYALLCICIRNSYSDRFCHIKPSHVILFHKILRGYGFCLPSNQVCNFIVLYFIVNFSYTLHFPQSMYFPTNALRNVTQLIHIRTATCFGFQMPSSGSNYNHICKIHCANYLQVYVLFVVISLIKTYNELCTLTTNFLIKFVYIQLFYLVTPWGWYLSAETYNLEMFIFVNRSMV